MESRSIQRRTGTVALAKACNALAAASRSVCATQLHKTTRVRVCEMRHVQFLAEHDVQNMPEDMGESQRQVLGHKRKVPGGGSQSGGDQSEKRDQSKKRGAIQIMTSGKTAGHCEDCTHTSSHTDDKERNYLRRRDVCGRYGVRSNNSFLDFFPQICDSSGSGGHRQNNKYTLE